MNISFSAFKDLTRLEQTFFALPFVLSGALLTLASSPMVATGWIWILPAFLLARISGMAFNQLIDREIDVKNPRTEKRVLPSGRITVGKARVVAWGALALFLIVSFQINLLTTILSLFAAFLIYIYSYMKRIHPSCHFVLGCIHFMGPVMAYSALTGTYSAAAFLLGGAAGLSIVGTDIAYAIQDYDFDCKHHLFSIPSRYGIDKSLTLATWIHFFSTLMLAAVGLSLHLSLFYYLILPAVTAIFFTFHLTLRKKLHANGSLKGIESSFFICNVAVSFTSLFFLFVSIVWDVLL